MSLVPIAVRFVWWFVRPYWWFGQWLYFTSKWLLWKPVEGSFLAARSFYRRFKLRNDADDARDAQGEAEPV